MNFAVFESHPGPLKVIIITYHTNWFSQGAFHESFHYEMTDLRNFSPSKVSHYNNIIIVPKNFSKTVEHFKSGCCTSTKWIVPRRIIKLLIFSHNTWNLDDVYSIQRATQSH